MLKINLKSAKGKRVIVFKIMIVLVCFTIWGFLAFVSFLHYLNTLGPFPDVRDYNAIPLPESTIIYDRDGNELYKIYDEKRTYVKYENISNDMINAVIAGEDKRFWDHPGYDSVGILRAIITGVVQRKPFSGTSGITQQLARVTYLSDERTIERKVKELYLSIELESIFNKEEILELYLNKIFFGGNSYGVEQASQTYFNKSAASIGILESSILASLPKAPSGLSPYNYKDKLLGYPVISIKDKDDTKIKVLSNDDYKKNKINLEKLEEFISKLSASKRGRSLEICDLQDFVDIGNFITNKEGCVEVRYNKLLSFLNSISIETINGDLSYKTGRKDYILGRMLEDGYISFEEYKKSILESFGFDFKDYHDDIKYPHFVMHVKEQLEELYTKEELSSLGLRIYTTIDPKLQSKAQELLEKQVEKNTEKFSARNGALLSIDNKTGEVLSMIGGVDYFDEENLGYNNMIFARIQPGSTFKPFVYLLAMIKHGFDKNTIFTDEKMVFPDGYSPRNSDDLYMGRMTLSKALNLSRNIPVVKAYYAAGEEDEIIKFLEPFGINNLSKFKREFKKKHGYNYVYSAPMSLGTVQITAWELAGAYSVFANRGVKKDFYSILEIRNSKGEVLEDFRGKNKSRKVLDKDRAVEMSEILSDTTKRPWDWNYFLTIPGHNMATKTGTSSKQEKSEIKGEKDIVHPRDLWTIGFTPQYTTLVWAGNTSGEALTGEAYGITGAGPVVRDFMKFIHKGLELEPWDK